MSIKNESDYLQGKQTAWLTVLRTSLRELDIDETKDLSWVIQREETYLCLRELLFKLDFAEDGIPSKQMYLPDILSKYVIPSLEDY